MKPSSTYTPYYKKKLIKNTKIQDKQNADQTRIKNVEIDQSGDLQMHGQSHMNTYQGEESLGGK